MLSWNIKVPKFDETISVSPEELRLILLRLAFAILNFMFGFLGGYNDYLGPMLYLTGRMEMKTLQQMISMLNDTLGTKWGIQMAGACIAVLPTMLLFLFAQRYFVEGISH